MRVANEPVESGKVCRALLWQARRGLRRGLKQDDGENELGSALTPALHDRFHGTRSLLPSETSAISQPDC